MPVELIEITAGGPASKKDEAVAFLVEAGSPGVVELDTVLPDNLLLSHTSESEPPPEGVVPPEARSASNTARLKAYLKPDASLSGLTDSLRNIGWGFDVSIYKDIDWVRKTRAAIWPVRVSGPVNKARKPWKRHSILIRPTWSKARKRPGEVVITLDPGMAFGTGSHFTTKSCLMAVLHLIDARLASPAKSTFLDVGTGTGVLAIAAKKLGVKRAAGVDIDPVAVETARANAKRNRVDIAVSVTPVEGVKGAFTVVTANILAGALKRLSPVIAAKTAKNGFLILSGILKEEGAEVSAVYERLGFKPLKNYSDGEWTTLILRK